MLKNPYAVRRIRVALIVITLATIPCYCIGFVAASRAPQSRPIPTFTLTPTQSLTPSPSITLTPTATLTPSPSADSDTRHPHGDDYNDQLPDQYQHEHDHSHQHIDAGTLSNRHRHLHGDDPTERHPDFTATVYRYGYTDRYTHPHRYADACDHHNHDNHHDDDGAITENE